jgi:hypothetical protein
MMVNVMRRVMGIGSSALNRNLLPSVKLRLVNGGFPLFEALDPISMALGSDQVAIGAHHGVCK